MVAIRKRGASSGKIPKPIKISLRQPKKEIDILPPPPPPGLKARKKKARIPVPLKTKKNLGLGIPIPLKEIGHEELPPPPPYIPFDLLHSKTDKLLGKELRLKEDKKLRELDNEKKSKELEIRRRDRELKKEISPLSYELKKHMRTIERYEKILSDEPEKLLNLNKKKLDQIKQELKSEEEYKTNSKEINQKLKRYGGLVKDNKTLLKRDIESLKELYQRYAHKAEGVRKAIFAKLDSVEGMRGQKEKEEQEELKIPEPRKEGFLNKLFQKTKEKEKSFIESERKRLEKLKEKEIKRKEGKEELKLDIEKELEKRAKEFKIPEFKGIPEAEAELPEIDELPPIEEEPEEKKRIKPARPDFRELLQKKEIAEPALKTGELLLQETEKETARREIIKAIERIKTITPTRPIENEFKEDIFYVISDMINDARDALLNLNIPKAKYIYIEIMRIYNRLDDDKKTRVYEAVKELYDERKAAEAMLNR